MTIYFVWRRSDGHVAAPTMPTHPRLQNSVGVSNPRFIRVFRPGRPLAGWPPFRPRACRYPAGVSASDSAGAPLIIFCTGVAVLLETRSK